MEGAWQEREQGLKRRASQGDRNAFDELFQRYYRRLRRMVARRLEFSEAVGELFGNELDPDDILDEAARRALTQLHQLDRPHLSFFTWMSRLALQVLRHEVERSARQHRQEISLFTPLSHSGGHADASPGEQLQLIDVVPDRESPIPEEVLLRQEFLAILRQVVGRRPRKEQTAFFLHELEGYSYAEVAEILYLSQREVRAIVQRIRGLLRQHLLQTGYFEEPET